MIMKQLKTYILFILLATYSPGFAQETGADEKRTGFKKENIFMGTSLNLGFSGQSFTIGLNPEIGYSVNKWLDAGLSFNFNYFSQNTSELGGSTQFRNFNYGGGTYV